MVHRGNMRGNREEISIKKPEKKEMKKKSGKSRIIPETEKKGSRSN